MPPTGLRVAAAGDQTATFVASGKIPEVGLIVDSASASAACNLTVLEILQTATQSGSDIDLGTSILTQRVLDSSTMTWKVNWNSAYIMLSLCLLQEAFASNEHSARTPPTDSNINGNPTTDVHYEASILNGFGKVIIHATMLNAAHTFRLYDGVFNTDPLSVKLSIEVYNWNSSDWTQTITGKYITATVRFLFALSD